MFAEDSVAPPFTLRQMSVRLTDTPQMNAGLTGTPGKEHSGVMTPRGPPHSPFSVTQYCFHFLRATSSSFLSFCKVTRGLKKSHPAFRTTPCSFSKSRSSCSRELSDSLLDSAVSVDVSAFSVLVLPISSSRMKFS